MTGAHHVHQLNGYSGAHIFARFIDRRISIRIEEGSGTEIQAVVYPGPESPEIAEGTSWTVTSGQLMIARGAITDVLDSWPEGTEPLEKFDPHYLRV